MSPWDSYKFSSVDSTSDLERPSLGRYDAGGKLRRCFPLSSSGNVAEDGIEAAVAALVEEVVVVVVVVIIVAGIGGREEEEEEADSTAWSSK